MIGKGYRLTMTKDTFCDTRATKELIRQYVPGAETISNVSGELAMSLPTEDEARLPELLKVLADKKGNIGVDNFGLSITTLEDVFLKVGAAAHDEDMEVSAAHFKMESINLGPFSH